MRRVSAATLLLAVGVTLPPAARAEPIGGAIAAGLAVEIIKGLTSLATKDGRAQVAAEVQIGGPDADDTAFSDPNTFDVDNWVLERKLDADTGIVRAPNAGDPHMGWAEIHYQFKDNAWRPNVTDHAAKEGVGGFVNVFAWAKSDTTPEPPKTNLNETGVASIAAYLANGVIKKTYQDKDGEVVAGPAAAERRVLVAGAPDSDSIPLASEAVAKLGFTAASFRITRTGDRVTVAIAGADGAGPVTVDLIHSTASTGPSAKVVAPMAGLDGFGGALAKDVFAAMAARSDGFGVYDDAAAAELTINGAALRFSPGSYARFDAAGHERSDLDLIRDYLADPIAVEVIAPTGAQLGFRPTIVFRQVTYGSEKVDLSGLSDGFFGLELPSLLFGTAPDGSSLADDTPLVSLAIGLRGDLLAALNLAAHDLASPFGRFFAGLSNGDVFDLETVISSAQAMFAGSSAIATIDTPEPGGLGVLAAAAGALVALRWRRACRSSSATPS